MSDFREKGDYVFGILGAAAGEDPELIDKIVEALSEDSSDTVASSNSFSEADKEKLAVLKSGVITGARYTFPHEIEVVGEKETAPGILSIYLNVGDKNHLLMLFGITSSPFSELPLEGDVHRVNVSEHFKGGKLTAAGYSKRGKDVGFSFLSPSNKPLRITASQWSTMQLPKG